MMAGGLLLMPGKGAMALTVAGMGLAGGCFGLLMNNTNPRFFGRRHLGAINGLTSSIIVIASALGPATFSLSRLGTGGYDLVFAVAVGAGLLLALAALKADNPQRKIAAPE
jgi:cyanate permease